MRYPAILSLAAAGAMALTAMAQPGANTVLKPAEMQKLLPASVFYRGQTATTQARNSGGVKFADGYYVLAAMVDTSGYSNDVNPKYQAWFVTEVPLKVGGQESAAGVYGVGFVAGDKFVVTDVGGHDVLTVASEEDAGLKRPMPLRVRGGAEGGYRLYAGRRYVTFSR